MQLRKCGDNELECKDKDREYKWLSRQCIKYINYNIRLVIIIIMVRKYNNIIIIIFLSKYYRLIMIFWCNTIYFS